MAILHIIAGPLDSQALTKLVNRSHAHDAYVFMDDGVYVLLNKDLSAFADRPIYGLVNHANERGITKLNTQAIKLITMSELVILTASYASSMSW